MPKFVDKKRDNPRPLIAGDTENDRDQSILRRFRNNDCGNAGLGFRSWTIKVMDLGGGVGWKVLARNEFRQFSHSVNSFSLI